MENKFTKSHIHAQARCTKTLIKFCIDHQYKSPYLENIRACLDALEKHDMQLAYENYSKVPLGGNGCFNDWWPPVVFEHEDPDYVWCIFEALVSQWYVNMESSKIKKLI